MSNIYDLDRVWKTECKLQHFTRNFRIKNLDDFERNEIDVYLWRAKLFNVKEKGMTICHMMNRFAKLCYIMFFREGKVARLKVNK